MIARYLRQVPDSLWRIRLIDGQLRTLVSCDCVGIPVPDVVVPMPHRVIIRTRPPARPPK